MPAFLDMTGHVYGRLTVLSLAPKDGGRTMWSCRCSCGTERTFWAGGLRNGNTASCGCLRAERILEANTTHGMCGHPVYDVWCGMRSRCSPQAERAKDYFDRGISVCERWQRFEPFWEDMGGTYRPGLTIERVDNDRGYEPGNCVWATYLAQGNNTRRNRVIETPDGPMTTSLAARRFGVNYQTLQYRVHKGITGSDLLRPAK